MGSSPAESTPSRSKHTNSHPWQGYILGIEKGRKSGPLVKRRKSGPFEPLTPSRSKDLFSHWWQCYVLSGVKGREGGPFEGDPLNL